jgi:hypothetical protein
MLSRSVRTTKFSYNISTFRDFKAPRRKRKARAVCNVNDRIQDGKQTVCRRPGRAPAWAQHKRRNLGNHMNISVLIVTNVTHGLLWDIVCFNFTMLRLFRLFFLVQFLIQTQLYSCVFPRCLLVFRSPCALSPSSDTSQIYL